MDHTSEYRARNERIFQHMDRVGIPSVAELARRSGVCHTTLCQLASMRLSPFYRTGEWRKEAVNVATLLACTLEDLFGEQQQEADEGETQVPMTMAQLAYCIGQSSDPTTAEEIETWVDRRIMLERAMQVLSARDAQVLTLRLANMLYEDVALIMKTNRERVRAIEARAINTVKKAVAQMLAMESI
ncbi:MAG: hypothetical protein HQL95_12895 [Magnetococcales bacterium]|nr:hypothetical protein [Magnetococcales bacterium]